MTDADRIVVLLAEDDLELSKRYIEELEHAEFEVHCATDEFSFFQHFSDFKSRIKTVVLSSVLCDDEKEPIRFIKYLRRELGDDVQIIANSANKSHSARLLEAGADWASGCQKINPVSIVGIINFG